MDNNKIGETGAIALAMALMENTSLTIVSKMIFRWGYQ
jgi:hypothetical protein